MPHAAVATALNQPLEIWEVDLAEPGPGEIRVQLAASGICHSDLSATTGTMPEKFPVVLGHEGAGVVDGVGPDVTGLAVGDHVVISWVPRCGRCRACLSGKAFLCSVGTKAMMTSPSPFSRAGDPVRRLGCCGTFADATVIPAIAAVKIPSDIPLESAALLGCCVLTGVGSALNTADIRTGNSVVVIGCGGIGLNAIQGAALAGAEQIIAVDIFPHKRELARTFGATDTVEGQSDPVAAVRELTGNRGADVVIEAAGQQLTIQQGLQMLCRGGQAILVGAPDPAVTLQESVQMSMILGAKTVKGCLYGSTDIARDVPLLLDHYRSGALKLDELISMRIPLHDINRALAALGAGEVARAVITHE